MRLDRSEKSVCGFIEASLKKRRRTSIPATIWFDRKEMGYLKFLLDKERIMSKDEFSNQFEVRLSFGLVQVTKMWQNKNGRRNQIKIDKLIEK